jgi:cytochrome P450
MATVGATLDGETLTREQRPPTQETAKVPPSPSLPRGLPGMLLGHAGFVMIKDPKDDPRTTPFHRLFERRADWYKETGSKTILTNLAGQKNIFCSDPAVYREVLSDKQSYFTNSNGFRAVFGYLFPKSMIVLEGADWQRVRRVSQKALNRMDMDKAIGAVIEVMDSAVEHKVLGNGEDTDTFKGLNYITFDVFHKVMYSMDPHAVTMDPKNPHVKLIRACDDLLFGIRYRAFTRNKKWLWDLPLKSNRKVTDARDYIVATGREIAAKRREELKKEVHAKDSKTSTLLDGLLLSQDEELMSDQEVSDQVATFFFGAFETTSNTLLFALGSLADHPQVQTKLREELKKQFPNGKADIAKATLADLDAIEYLLWVVDESFRMNSTASAFVRDCIKDVVVGGYKVDAGTTFMIDHRTASRDPYFWHNQTDLDEFKPERYAKYPMDSKLLSLPFGFGSRICPGRRIAVAQTKALIALLVSEYDILLPTDPAKKLVIDSKLGLTCLDGTGHLRFKKL